MQMSFLTLASTIFVKTDFRWPKFDGYYKVFSSRRRALLSSRRRSALYSTIIVIAPIFRIVNFGSSKITHTDNGWWVCPIISFRCRRFRQRLLWLNADQIAIRPAAFLRYGKWLRVLSEEVQNLRHISAWRNDRTSHVYRRYYFDR